MLFLVITSEGGDGTSWRIVGNVILPILYLPKPTRSHHISNSPKCSSTDVFNHKINSSTTISVLAYRTVLGKTHLPRKVFGHNSRTTGTHV